ncbi:class I SAM-dependent methyltransferase [Aestuariivita boseongensis]|uniref:class I SAM-dependent methyltransferase n=1 Tax=Aestuariivita boseongensis TaxID=1470562 RepID=UPI000B25F85B|nr:class I SAM-dependent methyltransferase [Aestuariivita boseongensis]
MKAKKMTTSAVFWDRIADKYSRQPVKNQTAYEQTLDATRAHLGPSDHVLELGCGTGSTALTLAGDVARITASDISPRMIAIAERKRAEAGVDNVEFMPAEVGEQVLNWQSYDAVLAFNLLHLVPDLDRTLSDIHAQLRPGGTFISKSACLGEMSFLIKGLVRGMQCFGRAPQVLYFNTKELEDAMRWAGFEVLSSRTFDKAPTARFIVARKPLAGK